MTFSNIAVCVDDSDAARRALDAARAIRPAGASLSVVHVVEPPSMLVELSLGVSGGVVGDVDAQAEAARAWLESLGEPGEAVEVLVGRPAVETLLGWAADAGCDLLVTATNRGRVERRLLGSFTRRVVEDAPCAVLTVPPAA